MTATTPFTLKKTGVGTARINITLTPELQDRLRAAAEANHTTMSDLIRQAIDYTTDSLGFGAGYKPKK